MSQHLLCKLFHRTLGKENVSEKFMVLIVIYTLKTITHSFIVKLHSIHEDVWK